METVRYFTLEHRLRVERSVDTVFESGRFDRFLGVDQCVNGLHGGQGAGSDLELGMAAFGVEFADINACLLDCHY